MDYRESDYLAKKIAEETVNQQKEAYNRHRIRVMRITLKFATVLTGICFLPLALIDISSITPFLIVLFITIRYCKTHPKK